MEVLFGDGTRRVVLLTLVRSLLLVRGLDQGPVRPQLVDGEELVRGVATYSHRQCQWRKGARTNDSLVEALFVQEDVPLDVVVLEFVLESHRGLDGGPREAGGGLRRRRRSGNWEELLQSIFVRSLVRHGVCRF